MTAALQRRRSWWRRLQLHVVAATGASAASPLTPRLSRRRRILKSSPPLQPAQISDWLMSSIWAVGCNSSGCSSSAVAPFPSRLRPRRGPFGAQSPQSYLLGYLQRIRDLAAEDL